MATKINDDKIENMSFTTTDVKRAYGSLRTNLNLSATSQKMGLTKNERFMLRDKIGNLKKEPNDSKIITSFVDATTSIGNNEMVIEENQADEFSLPSLFKKVK